MPDAESELPGIDRARVETWLDANAQPLRRPYTWTRLAGGHSNFTYRIADRDGRLAVVRRPPLGALLRNAHDMVREWRTLTGLAPTAVPVPRAIALCDDAGVTGAAFYVMSHVEGVPLRTADDTLRVVTEKRRQGLGESFIDILARLHEVDPEQAGLWDLGKPLNYVTRQVAAWHRSWVASVATAGFDDERAHELQRFLLARVPPQGPSRVVHGDYGLHNCLVTGEGGIAAVIDWELCTLGDPLADLAYALLPFPEPAENVVPPAAAATAPPGFPSRRHLAARYAAATGRDLRDLDFYLGFNLWKTAAIFHGMYARYRAGSKSAAGVDLAAIKSAVLDTLRGAATALERWDRTS